MAKESPITKDWNLHFLAHLSKVWDMLSGNIDPAFVDRKTILEVCHIIQTTTNQEELYQHIYMLNKLIRVINEEMIEFNKEFKQLKEYSHFKDERDKRHNFKKSIPI
jgi:hypothetical protein